MARLTPRSSRGLAAAGGLCGAALAILLSGCSDTTTYGTGVNPGTQTLKDIAGIAMMGGGNKPKIDYEPRAKVVAPPPAAAASLPPPAASSQGTQTAAASDGVANPPDWPQDPDLAAAKFKADIAAREARGEAPAPLKLPASSTPRDFPSATTGHDGEPIQQTYTAEQKAKIKKAFADAKGSLAVDANGKPVRRYLTEPPPEYREPDQTQPVAFTEKKKKFHWWWQKQDDTGDLTPADSTASDTDTTPAPNSHE